MKSYYSNPEVCARMLEFLCGDFPNRLSCEYLTAGDKNAPYHRQPQSVDKLGAFWRNDCDISRSLWDRESFIIDLDIEYVNFDFPGEAYLSPERIITLLQPVALAAKGILSNYGIRPLHLLSGRGPHFVWRIRQNSRPFKRLGQLGHVPETLKTLNAQPHRPNGRSIDSQLGRAYAGLALVMEFLAHRIKDQASAKCEIPVKVTAVEVGPGRHGREIVSIDVSEYGDPLSTRVIRVPFSLYLKPWQQRGLLGEQIVEHLPPLFVIPLDDLDSQQGSRIMKDTRQVMELARQVRAKIPDQTKSMKLLIEDYERSSLKTFHDWFYSEEPQPPAKWPETYDRIPAEILPLCVRHILEHPNDLLLRPANIERLVRVLLALGWHPRHIAGLIRSKFERDYGWQDRWKGYDQQTRADFYTRLFTGLFVTRKDNLVDFNCQSAKEENLCFADNCSFNLEHYKESLLNRRQYERLACRPFNRLLLSNEHN